MTEKLKQNRAATAAAPLQILLCAAASRAAANVLAKAAGGRAQIGPFSPSAVEEAVAKGQQCVVLWPDLASALARRNGAEPAEVLERWKQAVGSLLDVFRRHRAAIVLVEADLVESGGEAAAALKERLALRADLEPEPEAIGTGHTDDLSFAIATLYMNLPGNLADLVEELRASSYARAARPSSLVDLDEAARLVARAGTERELLRNQVALLQEALDTTEHQHARALAAEKAAERALSDLRAESKRRASLESELKKARATAGRPGQRDKELKDARDMLARITRDNTAMLATISAQAALKADADTARKRYDRLQKTFSWRITAPMRATARLFRAKKA
ncbi:hypothetical protein LXM94_15420 [Rhizobium sp. TRM95111]|uniref:hypothetical protein n=1 Tax=Rhizobium alarense TaxID=2846851 RepID=UPI001F2A2A50|nr:hypothetical protein [Rhizobium alarense]MCF3641364.1 hypothetical protein [Rhizobium alarense]